MKDLKSYFQSKVLTESTNSRIVSKETDLSPRKNTDGRRQCDPLSNDSASIMPKLVVTKKRKSCKDSGMDSEENIKLESDNGDSGEDESTKKSSARKKLRKKLPRKKTEPSPQCDISTSSSNRSKTTTNTTERPLHNPVTRLFKSVVIQDCMNLSSASSKSDKVLGKSKRKRGKNEDDQSEREDTDSSETFVENRFTGRPKTYGRKSATRECKEENNLLNYFAKAEKSVVPVRKLEDSPIDCLKRVKVVVQVHSPPKARRQKPQKTEKSQSYLSPVVRLFRTDAIKPLNLDAIEVIDTEYVNAGKPQTSTFRKAEDDQDSDTSVIFSSVRRSKLSSKKLNLEDTESESGSQAKEEDGPKESKTKKNVSFFGLEDEPVKLDSSIDTGSTSNYSKSSDGEDTPWKMRVQFFPKTKKPKKPKPKTKGDSANSSEDETLARKSKKIESKGLKETKTSKSEPKNEVVPHKQQKLAPLFCKQHRDSKKKLNNIVNVNDEAKRLFLSSGLPEVVKKKFDEQKTIADDEEGFACYKFPTTAHVQQKTSNFVWNLSEVDLTLKNIDEDVIVPTCDSRTSYVNKDVESVVTRSDEIDFNVKNEVAALKKSEPDVNVADVHTSVKRLNTEAESIDSVCWTDKYKPSNYGDLIGNASSMMKLKEWIESHKRLKVVRSDSDSSGDEFFDSEDSGCDSRKDNVAILVGPSGCGKTCAVYMLAKELGFKVLEVNAASNRNGKRLLDELLEATQSHQVKRATIFNEAAKNKKLMKKKKKKKSKDDREERKTMSLILIEDADILFEDHDEGFLNALSTLAKRSKRPLIFAVNDINYPHLAKYRNNLILRFEYPSRSLINVWLKLIALTEGVKLPDQVLVNIFHIAGLDVRRSLLQLQMLISSKNCHSTLDGAQLFHQDWCQRMTQCEKERQRQKPLPVAETEDYDRDLFSPKKENVTTDTIKEKNEWKVSKRDSETNRQSLEEHAKFLDDVAFLGRFENNQEEHIHPFENQGAFIEDLLSTDICLALKRILFSSFEDSKSCVSFSEYYSLARKNSKIKSVYQSTLSNLKIPLSDSYAKYCDFIPTLRTITRVEESKQTNQLKRTSRFFSYLKSVNICVSDSDIEFLRESMI